MKWTWILIILFCFESKAFLLIDPNYSLAKPTDTVVNVSSEGCTANGISDAELLAAIDDVLKSFWNTVTESRLRLKRGGRVSRSLSELAIPGEVLVGCSALGMTGASGVTYNSNENGSARVVLNASVFVPGGYTEEGLIGVLTHEMGHAIGLGHSGDAASVMTYESHEWGPRARFLSRDDKDGVSYLYSNEGELGGLVGGCSALAHQGVTRKPSPWGFLIEILLLIGLAKLLTRFIGGLRSFSSTR